MSEIPKAAPKKVKKRRGSKNDTDADFLSELQAMHSAVGSYMNEDVSQEDSEFFKQAHRTEQEVDELIKEIDEEVPEA